MDRGAGHTDEISCRGLRFHNDVESEFLSRGRSRGATLLFGMASDRNARPEFPCARSIRGTGFRDNQAALGCANLRAETRISKLVRGCVFAYAFAVKKSLTSPRRSFLKHKSKRRILLAAVTLLAWNCMALCHNPPQSGVEATPKVAKVEPPNWWVRLTPELMLLLAGQNLEATHASCNLPSVIVSRTQATAGGKYLFVWLKIGADTKPGTAVCRITTPKGATSFELPLAARAPTLGRFQGLSQDDVIYLIMPDRFANGDPTNDEPSSQPFSSTRPSDTPASHDRTKP